MLHVKDVSYSVGGRQVLNSATFSLGSGEKAAVVGVNGCGKTTLIKIIMGEISADEGSVNKPTRVGYLPQIITEELIVREGCTVEEYMLEGRGLNQIAVDMEDALRRMENPKSDEDLQAAMEQYGSCQDEFQRLGGYEAQSEISTVLFGIGVGVDTKQLVKTLSGGEKTRLAFGRVIFSSSDLLILDEPTNHIDRRYYKWLGEYLKGVNRTVLVVSHHPDFINPFTDRIIEVEKFTGRCREYRGSYEDYIQQSVMNETALRSKVEWVEKEIERLKKSALRLQYGGPNKAKAAQNMFGRIERLRRQRAEIADEIPQQERKLRFQLPMRERAGHVVLSTKGLGKSFDHEVFSNVNVEIHRGDRVVVLGPNGSGKTTFIRILMRLLQPDSGSVKFGHNVQLGYYAQEHEDLNDDFTVLEEIQHAAYGIQSNLRTLLGRFLFSGEKVFQSVKTLSQGEKSRLALCKLIVSGHNLLILDEPTNYLDPSSRDAVCEAIADYEGAVIVVTHDKQFLRKLNPEKVIMMPSGKTQPFAAKMLDD